MTAKQVRVVLADDHPMFREGLRFTLSQSPDITVVGEAADGEQALSLAQDTDPDVVLMDLNMPRVDGLTVTRALVEAGSRCHVLVLTMYDDDANVLAAMRAGAHGYLLKGAGPDQVLSAVCAVADGHAVFGASLAEQMLGIFQRSAEPSRGSPVPPGRTPSPSSPPGRRRCSPSSPKD